MSDPIAEPLHGGNLAAIAAATGIAARSLLDFSANVNPLGPPESLLRALAGAAADRDDLTRYPEPTYAALREALARMHAIDPASIVVGNGSAALLEAAIAALGVRRGLVPTPAFSEYRRALASRGATFIAAPLDRARDFALDPAYVLARAGVDRADTVLLNTPHNPSGSALARSACRALVEALAGEARATIVDEAFVDYIEGESIVALAAERESLVVVRSLTKFFAVPGLRVGFAVAHPGLATRMRAYLPSWSVTSIAARSIAHALGDTGFAERSRAANESAREALRRELSTIGFRALPSVANYVLAELPTALSATTLTRRAIEEHGIVLRDCTSYDDLEDGRFVRIAVRTPAENARLIAALARVCEPTRACAPERTIR
jgi:threonine-phosphate decarboxylase